jgi:hypothetical protein
MDGSQKALAEIEILGRKKPFVVPNSVLNLHYIISKTQEGSMGDLLSREKSKFKSIISRDLGEVFYLID